MSQTLATSQVESSALEQFYGAIDWVQTVLSHHIDPDSADTIPEAAPPLSRSLKQLSQSFGLSSFEEKIVLLCAAMELEPTCHSLCAQIAQNPEQNYPTLVLALSLFTDASWEILSTYRPLIKWQLLQFEPHPSRLQARISLDRRVLNYLLDVQSMDEQLHPWVEPLPFKPVNLPGSQAKIAQQITSDWQSGNNKLVQLCGSDDPGKTAIAQTLAQTLNLRLYQLQANNLPTDLRALSTLKQRWLREAILSQAILLIDCDDSYHRSSAQHNALSFWIKNLDIPLIISTQQRLSFTKRTCHTYDIKSLPHAEKRQLWEQCLGDRTTALNGHLEPIIAQFNLNSHTIQSACTVVQDTPIEHLADELWRYCRSQARPQLDELAQRIDCTATWDELILPEREKSVLTSLSAQVKQRAKVYAQWGFSSKSSRGLGISALFAGPSGTGKTMAAEVLAREFKLDLYRIDLSAVSSKYIGETEKNLRRIFDAAESGGAVLLFDEADALFGKRTEVSSSHDRHANLEVSYLLQRMEAYQGLSILTTNLKDSLDQAFIRRLRFIINFPYPKKEARSEIWTNIFPQQTPTQGLDYKLLGQLDMAGGNIRSVALNAAFIAADADEPVMMKHILTAAQAECTKIGRALSRKEIASWLPTTNKEK